MAFIFISHSEKDKAVVESLCSLLDKFQFDHYIAERPEEFDPNDELPTRIQGELRRCHCLIAIITARSKDSAWVNQEIGFALGAGKPLVTIVQGKIRPKGFVQARQRARFARRPANSQDVKGKVIPYLLNLRKREEKP